MYTFLNSQYKFLTINMGHLQFYTVQPVKRMVLITTKNGKKGDVKVDFSTYLSFTHVAKDLDMLDADVL